MPLCGYTAADEAACLVKVQDGSLNCSTDTQCQGTKICSCQNFLDKPPANAQLSCRTNQSPCADSGHPICIRPNAPTPDKSRGVIVNSCAIGYNVNVDSNVCRLAILDLVAKYLPRCTPNICYQYTGAGNYEKFVPNSAQPSVIAYRLRNPSYNAQMCEECTKLLIPDELVILSVAQNLTANPKINGQTDQALGPPPRTVDLGKFHASYNGTYEYLNVANSWCVENKIVELYSPGRILQFFGPGASMACYYGIKDFLYNPITAPDNDKDDVPEISTDALRITGIDPALSDNCPAIANPTQKDRNKNNKGCECDPEEICVNTGNIAVCDIAKPRPPTPPTTDPDCDGIPNFPMNMIEELRKDFGNDFKIDNCPEHYNPLRVDLNKNSEGCQCDVDEECAWQSPLCTSLRGTDNCTPVRPLSCTSQIPANELR